MNEAEPFSRKVDIPITAEEIHILATRATGWERLWGKIYGLLGMALDERIKRLDKIDPTIKWPPDGAQEEFAALMLEHFERRFDNGFLFSADAMEDCDLATSLLAFSFLRLRAISFCSRRRVNVLHSIDEPVSVGNNDNADTMADTLNERNRRVVLHDNRMHSENYAEKRENMDRSLSNLSIVVATPANPTVVEQQAGMQLYPRCDWTPPDMRQLHHAVGISLASDQRNEDDAWNNLKASHLERKKSLEENFLTLHNELAKLSLKAEKKFFTLVNSMNKTTFEYLFRPLNAETLMKLLGIKRDKADKLRERYRDDLEALLRGNPVIDKALSMEDGK